MLARQLHLRALAQIRFVGMLGKTEIFRSEKALPDNRELIPEDDDVASVDRSP